MLPFNKTQKKKGENLIYNDATRMEIQSFINRKVRVKQNKSTSESTSLHKVISQKIPIGPL